MSRLTKLNIQVQDRISEALMLGHYFDSACTYGGISQATGYNWLARGRDELERREGKNVREKTKKWDKEQIYVEFLEAIEKAAVHAESEALAIIRKASRENWQAGGWFLERRYPKKWGRKFIEKKGETEHSGKVVIEYVYPPAPESDDK